MMRITVFIGWKPAFRELWLLVSAFGNSLFVLFWGVIIAVILCLLFGVFTTTVVVRNWKEFELTKATDYWGTLKLSVASLFRILTLDDWYALVSPVTERYPVMIAVFGMFIALSVYALANLLVAVLVDSALSLAASSDAQRWVELERHIRAFRENFTHTPPRNLEADLIFQTTCLKQPPLIMETTELKQPPIIIQQQLQQPPQSPSRQMRHIPFPSESFPPDALAISKLAASPSIPPQLTSNSTLQPLSSSVCNNDYFYRKKLSSETTELSIMVSEAEGCTRGEYSEGGGVSGV
eukprot:GHVR01055153.1.p1 GENE.GHVR01055153.1~~GHVR01055153.1.p1  ORF type:complete len:294 (+),score=82.16 GHVR01055153.1:576-1457(+)